MRPDPPTLDLRHVRSFVAVAEHLHFTRAAQRVGVSQQAVTQHVAHLEATLGAVLLQRRPRVRLTPAGAVLLREGRALLAAAERAASRTAAAGQELRLAYTSIASFETLPALLAAMARAQPATVVTTGELEPRQVEAALLEGHYDAGLCGEPPADERLVADLVRSESLAAIVSAGHPLAGEQRIELGALARERFLLFARELSPGYHDVLMTACREAGFEPRLLPNPVPRSHYMAPIAAQQAVGLTVCSFERSAPRGVRVVPLADARTRARLLVVRLCDGGNKAGERFARCALHAAAEHGWLAARTRGDITPLGARAAGLRSG